MLFILRRPINFIIYFFCKNELKRLNWLNIRSRALWRRNPNICLKTKLHNFYASHSKQKVLMLMVFVSFFSRYCYRLVMILNICCLWILSKFSARATDSTIIFTYNFHYFFYANKIHWRRHYTVLLIFYQNILKIWELYLAFLSHFLQMKFNTYEINADIWTSATIHFYFIFE